MQPEVHDVRDEMWRWSHARLLREASSGNADAFKVFCVKAIPGLRRYVKYQCRALNVPNAEDNDLVGDFCQTALSKALEHVRACSLSTGRHFPRVSAAWLHQIAYHVIIDWTRRDRYVGLGDDFEAEATEPELLEDIEEQEEIIKFTSWLKHEEQQLLELVFVDELTIEAAGAKLGLSKWSSYKAYKSALDHLRELLEQHGMAPVGVDSSK